MKKYGLVKFDIENNRWVIEKLDPQVSIRFKKIFPKISEARVPPYYLSNTDETCMELEWFFSRYPVNMDSATENYLKTGTIQFKEKEEKLNKILEKEYRPKKVKLKEGHTLDKDQLIAVDYAFNTGRLLLVDPMGSGKTYTAIGTALKFNKFPAAFVVQTHLATQFQSKIREITNLTTHIITSRTPYELPPADIYIFKYSNIGGWSDIANTGVFKFLVFDEVQELRHGIDTTKGIAAEIFSRNAENVLATTGSPIYGYGIEFYNVINILNPDTLGTRNEFIREWCSDGGKMIRDERAFGNYLSEMHIMLNRKDTLKMKNLKFRIIPQKVDYDMEKVASVEELAKQLAIGTLSNDFATSGQSARQLDLQLRKVTGVSKANYVAQFIRMLVESGEKVLVAGWHRDVYDIWMKELRDLGVVLYTGSENTTKKNKNKERFISGSANVMFISHISGAGLDGLQHVCSKVVIGELAWSEQIHEQIIARLLRRGQLKEVYAFIMLSDYGSDPVIKRILNIKYQQQEAILNPDKKFEKIIVDKSRVKELAKEYLKSLNVELPETKNIEDNEKIIIEEEILTEEENIEVEMNTKNIVFDI